MPCALCGPLRKRAHHVSTLLLIISSVPSQPEAGCGRVRSGHLRRDVFFLGHALALRLKQRALGSLSGSQQTERHSLPAVGNLSEPEGPPLRRRVRCATVVDDSPWAVPAGAMCH